MIALPFTKIIKDMGKGVGWVVDIRSLALDQIILNYILFFQVVGLSLKKKMKEAWAGGAKLRAINAYWVFKSL